MAVTFATLTVDPNTLADATPSSPVIVTVRTNTDGAILDAAGDKIFLGTVSSKGTGTATFSLPVTNGASNPTGFQYTVDISYSYTKPDGSRDRTTWNSGWFSFTASANLADIAAEQYVPPTWMSTAITTLEGYVDDAEAARDAAIAAGLVWRGAWNGATAYSVADAVSYSGSSYRRLVAGTTAGTPAADTTNWGILASKGDTGATGATGSTGATGATGAQGLPGPGSAAWTAAQAVSVGTVRQSPTGEWIRSSSARTTGASYDSTEAGFWTPIHVLFTRTLADNDSATIKSTATPRSSAKFNENVHSFPIAKVGAPGGTYTNTVYQWGYNVAATSAREVSTEPMFRIGMESSWWDAGSSRTWSELHLGAFIDPNSPDGNEIRPISVGVVWGLNSNKGGPSISFTVHDGAEVTGWVVTDVAGNSLMTYSAGSWTFGRNISLNRGASAESLFTIGAHLESAGLVLDAKSSGGVGSIRYQRGGTDSWYLYDAGDVGSFYLRDITNSRMMAEFYKGASDSAASIVFNSTLHVKGPSGKFGPSSNNVTVGSLGTSDAWVDAAQSGNANVALNLRSAGTSPIVSLTRHRFDGNVGFYGTTPVAKPTGVAVTAAGIHAALVTLGLIAA